MLYSVCRGRGGAYLAGGDGWYPGERGRVGGERVDVGDGIGGEADEPPPRLAAGARGEAEEVEELGADLHGGRDQRADGHGIATGDLGREPLMQPPGLIASVEHEPGWHGDALGVHDDQRPPSSSGEALVTFAGYFVIQSWHTGIVPAGRSHVHTIQARARAPTPRRAHAPTRPHARARARPRAHARGHARPGCSTPPVFHVEQKTRLTRAKICAHRPRIAWPEKIFCAKTPINPQKTKFIENNCGLRLESGYKGGRRE